MSFLETSITVRLSPVAMQLCHTLSMLHKGNDYYSMQILLLIRFEERERERERERGGGGGHYHMRPTVLLIYSCLLLTDIHSRTLEYPLDEQIEKCSINIFLASYRCCQVVLPWLISE